MGVFKQNQIVELQSRVNASLVYLTRTTTFIDGRRMSLVSVTFPLQGRVTEINDMHICKVGVSLL